jgi:acetyl esterase/lipase
MRLLNVTLAVLLMTPLLRAGDFDLSYDPKSKEECARIMKEMLNTGEEIAYREDHQNQKLWVFRPAGLKQEELRACVMFVHGGGWGGDPETLAPQCVYLTRRGLVAVTIHFRRPGPSPKDCLADCLSAYRWVKKHGRQYNIDPDRIVVSGGSAGGHLSLAMVTISGCDHPDDDRSVPIDPKALILFNPAIDLVDGWQGGREKCIKGGVDPAKFSPAHHVKPGLPETLVLSGENDNVITPDQIRKFMERMKAHGNACSVVLYPDAKHGWFNYGRSDNSAFHETMAEVEKFLTKLGYMGDPKEPAVESRPGNT